MGRPHSFDALVRILNVLFLCGVVNSADASAASFERLHL